MGWLMVRERGDGIAYEEIGTVAKDDKRSFKPVGGPSHLADELVVAIALEGRHCSLTGNAGTEID
jgi:hypothetical protein